MRTTYIHTVLIIILLGAAIRFYNIHGQQLWADEIDTLYRARNFWDFYPTYLFYQSEKYNSPKTSIYSLSDFNGFSNHQPLYYTLLALWTKLFGFTTTSARLLSVLFSLLTIFAVFLLATELFSERAGIFAAFIFAISPFHLYYAHELRDYALVMLLAVLSSLFFWKVLKKQRCIFWYGLFTGLLLLSHTHTFFLVFAQWLFVVFFYRQSFKQFFYGQLVSFLIYLPWLPHFINQLRFIDASRSVYFTFNFIDLPAVYLVFGLGQTLIVKESPWFFLITISILYLLSFAAVALFALYKGKKDTNTYLLLWLVVPVVLPWSISYIIPVYTYRYASVAAPALALLLGEGYAILEKKSKTTFVFLLVILGLLSVSSFIMYEVLPSRQQTQELADYLAFHVDNESIYVFHWNYHLLLRYYHPELPIYGISKGLSDILVPSEIEKFVSLVKPLRSFWFVYGSARNKEEIDKIIINAGYRATTIKKMVGFYAYHYEKI